MIKSREIFNYKNIQRIKNFLFNTLINMQHAYFFLLTINKNSNLIQNLRIK
jgi:hypothetical protein